MTLAREVLRTAARSYTVVIVVALVVGFAVGPVAGDLVAGDRSPDAAIAIVPIDGTITASRAEAVAWDLREVRRRGDVKAVVLQVDSPGGSAPASEHLYLAVRRTAAEMPVVVSVQQTAASGAYYASLPADAIYVTPAAIVGSVGVRASYPSGGFGRQIITGPDKNTGGTTAEARARVETIKRAFLGAVMRHRGDRLTVPREAVANAKIYTGARAIETGFADDVGVLDDAVADAADRAGLEDYRVLHTRLGSGTRFTGVTGENPYRPAEDDLTGYEGADTVRYLMLWGQVAPVEPATTDARRPANRSTPAGVTANGPA